MEMQIVAVPLFDADMNVESFMFRYRIGNDLFSSTQATSVFDSVGRSPVLDTLKVVGLEAFTLGKNIFVPISHITLLGDLDSQCNEPPGRVIFLFEEPFKPEATHVEKMSALREKGYRFAVRDLEALPPFTALLKYTSYCFLSQSEKLAAHSDQILSDLRMFYPQIIPVAYHIATQELQDSLYGKGYALYESRFHHVPASKNDVEVTPLKSSTIQLLNTVQDENFDFDQVASIVQRDPALTISLMKMVNHPQLGVRNKIKTISHAVAMLGQQEVRKWVATAVSQELAHDKPAEIVRISLLRAKFAENLASLFGMENMAQGIFLMGLFSVLDVMLDIPMEEALKKVVVSDPIQRALLEKAGPFYPVLNMAQDYEAANWSSVSRLMIVYDISESQLSTAYVNSLLWYRNLVLLDEAEPEEDSDSLPDDSEE